MRRGNVLVVEDDEDIQQLIIFNLSKANYLVKCVDSGEEALQQIGAEKPDIILLDIMLPGMSGLEVCRAIRRINSIKEIPVIMLTSKNEDEDIVAGLDIGADDYITKPFSPRIIVARINTVLRRKSQTQYQNPPSEESRIVVDSLIIDPEKYSVQINGIPIELTLTEFNILKLIAKRPGWVFTRQQILNATRGHESYAVSMRAIDVHIFGLRKKIREFGPRIEAVRGIGYRFRD
ncbi:response regulator [Desulfobacterota bacterium M19]